MIEGQRSARLRSAAAATGVMVVTGEDEIFLRERSADFRRNSASDAPRRRLVEGDAVRDWGCANELDAIYEYGPDGKHHLHPALDRYFWSYRGVMRPAIYFGKTKEQRGMHWREYGVLVKDKLRDSLSIAFAEIATHNHFVLDHGGRVFKQTAPVIKLPAGSSEDDHLGLLGLLNSSVACFWLKQVCFPKGGDHVGNEGARVRKTLWDERYAFNATNIGDFPLPRSRPLALAQRLDQFAQAIAANAPSALLDRPSLPDRTALSTSRDLAACLQCQMIAVQEELDWQCYGYFGLLRSGAAAADFESAAPPELNLGERAFEIVLARRVAAGDEDTAWFERHGSTPITNLPAHWPADYRAVVERRIALIESDRNIGLIERPEFKRRWNTPAWDDLEKAALREWLLDRLEQPAFWPASADTPPQLTTTNRLADLARADAPFLQVAALYAGHADFDPARLVAELVAAEAVPLLPVQRYTDEGLRKRAQWESTWALQRREDAIDAQVVADNADAWRSEFAATACTTFGSDTTDEARAWIAQKLAAEIKRHQDERKAAEIGPIPVPPKYKSSDFLKAAKTDYWRLRGGLDVPKERFVSFPGAERGADGSLPIAWAGWNHLQLATALAGYYGDMKDTEGWEPAPLQPLLAGLLELVPWLEQWHNDLDPVFGERMGTYYKGFVTEEARSVGFTLEDLRAWKPTAVAAKRGRKKATARDNA